MIHFLLDLLADDRDQQLTKTTQPRPPSTDTSNGIEDTNPNFTEQRILTILEYKELKALADLEWKQCQSVSSQETN
jgi:hypothetical protein